MLRKLSLNLQSSPCLINLMQWMKKHGWSQTCSLRPVEFYDTGRGLMAETYVPRNQVIVSIPLELLITLSVVERSGIGWLFSKANAVPLLAQQVLAAFLVWEKHLGQRSVWEPYLNSVPLEYSMPLFCSNEELELLPSVLLKPILSHRNKVIDTFSDLRRILNMQCWKCWHCSESLSSIIQCDQYWWAWCAVNTRCIYLDEKVLSHSLKIQDNSCLALAPYLDMFNHSNDVDVKVGLSSDKNSYEIQTLVPFAKNTQVFIHYGDHSNLKLYTEYGFIIPQNPYDYIPLTFEEVVNSVKDTYPVEFKCSTTKLNFLKGHNLTENLSCNYEGLSFNVKALIYMFMTSESRKDVLALKIYSFNFTSEESMHICKVGKHLIKQKYLEFESVLKIMEQKITNGCSRSFEVASDLVLAYVNLLKRAEISVM